MKKQTTDKKREEFIEEIWGFARKRCDSFDLIGIHRCSAGHCGRCGECDVLSDLISELTNKEVKE